MALDIDLHQADGPVEGQVVESDGRDGFVTVAPDEPAGATIA